MSAQKWPRPAKVPLQATPSACPPGCALTVVGHGFIDRTVRLYVDSDAGRTPLALVSAHDGDFTWTGPLPAGVLPGNVVIGSPDGQVDLTVLPPGAPATSLVAGPVPAVATLPAGNLRYPPASVGPQPAAVAVAAGKDIWVGGAVCGGAAQVCSAAAWVSTDGGGTWRQGFGDAGGSGVSALAFGDTRTGLLVDGRGLWRTGDGGAHWAQVGWTAAPPVVLAASDAQQFAAVGPGGRVWTSADGGQRWTEAGQACPTGMNLPAAAVAQGCALLAPNRSRRRDAACPPRRRRPPTVLVPPCW